ncbi:MAG: hypothetical protein AAGI66_05780 [Cyanobacteria bacterium P01_H01_bin.74]
MPEDSTIIETAVSQPEHQVTAEDYDEFEVGEHKVPWFLWVFFILIVLWASVSWIPFFGY